MQQSLTVPQDDLGHHSFHASNLTHQLNLLTMHCNSPNTMSPGPVELTTPKTSTGRGVHKNIITIGEQDFLQDAASTADITKFQMEPFYMDMECEGRMKHTMQKRLAWHLRSHLAAVTRHGCISLVLTEDVYDLAFLQSSKASFGNCQRVLVLIKPTSTCRGRTQMTGHLLKQHHSP